MSDSVHVAESKNKNLKDKKNSLVLKLNEIKAKLIQKSGSIHDIEMSAHDIFRIMGIFVDFIQEAEEAMKNEKNKASKDAAKKMAKKIGYELKEKLSIFNTRLEEKLTQHKNTNKPRADASDLVGLPPDDKVLNEIENVKEKFTSMESEMQRLLQLL